MILVIIFLTLVMIGGGIWQARTGLDGMAGGLIAGTAGFFLIFALLFAVKWQYSSDTLTGYVYQRNDRYGFVEYSLRFSQNAGMDAQPSFCVKAGSPEDKQIAKYVGTNTKVQIATPSSNFRIANNIFECASYSTLDKVLEENEAQ